MDFSQKLEVLPRGIFTCGSPNAIKKQRSFGWNMSQNFFCSSKCIMYDGDILKRPNSMCE